MRSTSLAQVDWDRLIADLKAVVHDAEELLKATADLAGEQISAVRARVEASLRAAREKLAAAMDSDIVHQVRDAAGCTDRCARGKPWLAIGAGVACRARCALPAPIVLNLVIHWSRT
jgi:ElaB/YqjD/DUF883 family membrane-anchored ribosome-binding protein